MAAPEIAMIKVAVPLMAQTLIDRCIQVGALLPHFFNGAALHLHYMCILITSNVWLRGTTAPSPFCVVFITYFVLFVADCITAVVIRVVFCRECYACCRLFRLLWTVLRLL